MSNIKFLLPILLLICSQAMAATPTVTNVTGTVSNGQTLTITGTNMVNENSANWRRNDGFSGDVLDQTYFTGSTGNVGGSQYGWESAVTGISTSTYDTTTYLVGDRSAKLVDSHLCGEVPDCGYSTIYSSFEDGGDNLLPANFYMASYIRFNGDFAGEDQGGGIVAGYQKFWLTVGAVEQFYMFAGINGDGTATGMAFKNASWGEALVKYGSFEWTKDTWHYVELEVNTTDYSGDRYTLWWDGVQVAQHIFPGHSGADPHYNHLGIPNWAVSAVPFTMWVNRHVYSSSRIYPASVVEISDNPTYHAGAYVYQEPVRLSETSSQVKVTLPPGSGPFYLHVTNNRNEHTVAPYNLSGSPGPDVTAPITTANPAAGEYTSSQTISLPCSDNVACATTNPTQSCWGVSCTPSSNYSTPLTIQAGTLGYRSTDTSSNVETTKYSAYTIAASDTTPPVVSGIIPYGILAYGTTSATLQASTNEAATCRHDQSDLAYSSMVNNFSTTGGTTHSTAISGLYNGGNYTYFLRCIDASGNESISVSTNYTVSTTPPSSVTLFTEAWEDSSIENRGWYDNTAHGTIVSGGQSGNCLQYSFAQGGFQPTNGGGTRKQFTPTDTLYVSFYVKFESGWRGSQQNYHPHIVMITSDIDDADPYTPLAYNYLNTYIEFLSDVGSPYEIRPQVQLQDGQNVNPDTLPIPNDLTATSENRSVNYCNTPVTSGWTGTCYEYNEHPYYYSANETVAGSVDVSKNVWHRVEVYLKMNTIVGGIGQSNGILTEWIDGIKVLDHTTVLYRTNEYPTMKWAQFVLAPWIGDGSPIAQTMWLDELTVATGMPAGAAGQCSLSGPDAAALTGPDSATIQ